MTEMSSHQNKNRVSKDLKNISKNSKSYDEKIKIVMSYYKSLSPGEKQKFYNSALHQRSFGTPTPERGSVDEGVLLIEWYDKSGG